MKKKLSRYSTINTIKNCHKSQHNGENHKFYTHNGEFQLPIYFRQKPTPKINKGTNNETLVYKEKNWWKFQNMIGICMQTVGIWSVELLS